MSNSRPGIIIIILILSAFIFPECHAGVLKINNEPVKLEIRKAEKSSIRITVKPADDKSDRDC